MSVDTSLPKSRRAILAATVGALAATVAQAFGRPNEVRAGVDGDVVLGVDNVHNGTTALSATTASPFRATSQSGVAITALTGNSTAIIGASQLVAIQGLSTNSIGVWGRGNTGILGMSPSMTAVAGVATPGSNPGSAPAKTGVYGYSNIDSGATGVHGKSVLGTGVRAESTSGFAINAQSSSSLAVRAFSSSSSAIDAQTSSGFQAVFAGAIGGYAVRAANSSATNPAILAMANEDAAGIAGTSGIGPTVPTVPAKVGVYGFAGQDSSARGTVGRSTAGTGVHGFVGAAAAPAPASKTGVYGRCDIDATARGVSGFSGPGAALYGGTTTGAAVQGIATDPTGFGLKSSGRVSLSKVSGMATLAPGSTSVTVSPGTDIVVSTFVLLTPQGDPGNRRLWATVNAAANTITINVTPAVAGSLRVAWLALG